MPDVATTSSQVKPRNLVGIMAYLGRHPRLCALAVSLLLVNICIEMSLPQIIGSAMTQLQYHFEWGATFSPAVFVQLYLSLVLVRAGVGMLLGPIRNRVIQRTLGDIRNAIYDSLQRLAFRYHDKANTGELISRSTTDVFRLQDFFFACLFISIDIAVSLVIIIVLIFAVRPLLGWVTLATVIPTIALIAFYASKLQPQWRKVHDLHGEMNTVIQENIAGVRVVKAFAREQSEVAKFRTKRDVFLGRLSDTVNYWAARVPVAQFVFGLTTPLALWLGGQMVIRGGMPVGDLAKIVLYLMAVGHRMGMVGQFTNIVQNASASAERILEIIHEPKTIRSGEKEFPAGRGAVEFDRVSFRYFDGKASLTDVSFRIEPGQTVAIVGPTGSGKTTLVNLIPRFYDVDEGRVLIDGEDVRNLRLMELRRSVGVMFQETFLFSATAAENIAFGQPEATREDIERCARAAQAHEFISELENGYDTVIGERGVSLSGGQRQRIAIARAFLMDPRILILDDATASVDSQTERLIREAMRKLCAGRTTFVIAQRLSTVQHADVILVLQQGRIVERGRHDELIQRSGFYRDVFEGQLRR